MTNWIDDPELLHTIEAYVDGQLAEADLLQFEQLLKGNAELRKAVKVVQVERIAEKLMLRNSIKQQLEELNEKYPVQLEEDESGKSRKWLWVLLGIGILLAITAYFFSNRHTESTKIIVEKQQDGTTSTIKTGKEQEGKDKIINKNNQPVRPKPRAQVPLKQLRIAEQAYKIPRSITPNNTMGASDTQTAYEKAQGYFADTLYSKALEALKTPAKGDIVKSAYLRGHIYFHLKKFDQAVEEFRYVIQQDSVLKASGKDGADDFQGAQWFELLSLLCIQPYPSPEISQLFDDILNVKEGQFHPYQEKATALKQQLDQH